jgi:hypothetical protein
MQLMMKTTSWEEYCGQCYYSQICSSLLQDTLYVSNTHSKEHTLIILNCTNYRQTTDIIGPIINELRCVCFHFSLWGFEERNIIHHTGIYWQERNPSCGKWRLHRLLAFKFPRDMVLWITLENSHFAVVGDRDTTSFLFIIYI